MRVIASFPYSNTDTRLSIDFFIQPMVLVVPTVETTITGRPLLAPGEVEHMLMDAVDVIITSGGSPQRQHKDGRAILTSHRLLWLPSNAAHVSLSLFLVTILAPELRASVSSFLTTRKLSLGVLCSSDGTPLPYGSSLPGQLPIECRVTLLCRDKSSHVATFHTRLLQLHQNALESTTRRHAQHTATSLPSQQSSVGPLTAGLSLPPTSSSTSAHDRDALLAQLLAMGFAEHPAAHAAQATSGVEQALEWLLARQGDPLLDLPPTTTQYSNTRVQGAGVAGLLHREVQRAAATDQSLDEAFRDLDALMIQAGDMVALAQRFRGQLLAAEGENAEARALEADLVAMGIANPITRDAAGKAFHRELARQLGDFLAPQLVKSGGMMTLPDVYCLFNRARGAELVSPDDLLQAAAQLPDVGADLQLHTLPSGLVVIQSAAFSTAQVAARLVTLLDETESALQGASGLVTGLGPALTAPEVGSRLGVPVTIAGEWLLAAESQGVLCRDDAEEGLRFFRNFFEAVATA